MIEKKVNKVDIQSINDRISDTSDEIEALQIKLQTAEYECSQAKKLLALQASPENVEAAEATGEKVIRIRGEIEDKKVLLESLQDELIKSGPVVSGKKVTKIDIFKQKVSDIENRISGIPDEIRALEVELEAAECEHNQARKTLALQTSPENIKAMEAKKEAATKLKERLELKKILPLALADELKKAGAELSEAEREQKLEQIKNIGKHAADYIKAYNEAIRTAHKARYCLKLGASIAQGYHLEPELRQVCPEYPSVSSLSMLPDLNILEFSEATRTFTRLFDSEYDKKAVLAELIS